MTYFLCSLQHQDKCRINNMTFTSIAKIPNSNKSRPILVTPGEKATLLSLLGLLSATVVLLTHLR